MQTMPAQPLEINDFSGGITENILQGDPRRYQYADNFLITVDKKLRVRPPFLPLENSQLPSGQQRVTSMYSWINETFLVGQSERSFYYRDFYNNAWVGIPGVAGNPALSGADKYAQTTYAEFQKHIYLTSDGGIDENGSLPFKIYKNDADVWKAVTAGLPRAFSSGTYTDATLLAACIALANDVRASMIAHFGDAYFSVYSSASANFNTGFLHSNIDKVALSYLQATTFTPGVDPTIPSPLPTPAPAATDQATLFALVVAMAKAYTAHTTDALLGSYNVSSAATYLVTPKYHYPIQQIAGAPPIKGPLGSLTSTVVPIDLTTAASQLDNLRQQWYFHRLAINTHSKTNQFAGINKYSVSAPAIGRVSIGNTYPILTPDYTDFFNYANNLKSVYNGHIGRNGPHTQPPTGVLEVTTGYTRDTSIYCPDCSDIDSMYLLIYWLRAQYFIHYLDAATSVFGITTTTGKGNINGILGLTNDCWVQLGFPDFNTVATLVGQWLYQPNALASSASTYSPVPGSTTIVPTTPPTTGNWIAQCIATNFSTTAQAQMDRILTGAYVTNGLQYSKSWYHSANSAGILVATANSQTGAAESLSSGPTTLGTDLPTWMALASEMFFSLGNHAFNTNIHAIYNYVSAGAGNVPQTAGTQYDSAVTWNSYSIQACATSFFIPVVGTFSYAFDYKHDYKVGINGIEYIVRSNPVVSDSVFGPISWPVNYTLPSENSDLYSDVGNPATRSIQLSNIASLVNTPETNYDLANVKLEIYRTTDGGTTYYLEREVDNGTTSFTDSANDNVESNGFPILSTQDRIYTTGAVVGSDQPPKCKFIHILNETVYYGAIFDTGQFFPQRILQAVQGSPDYAPATFTDDLDDDLTGLSSAKNNLIAFCKNSISRLQGGFNSTGQGLLTHEKISDSLGSLNAKSIIRTEIGVFFAGNDGFYYTDGFQIIKISLELDHTYQALTESASQRRAIYGAYDKTTRRVWWSMRSSPTDSDNSVFYIYYLDYGVKPSGVFTTASNFPYMRPSSMVFQSGVLYYGHELGYVLYGDENNKQDAVIDSSISPTLWKGMVIPYNYTGCAIDLGTTFKRKWITKIHSIGSNIGNAAIQMAAIKDLNDNGDGIKNMGPINYTDNPTWGTPICVWGDPAQIWGPRGKVDLWRRFPMRALRSDLVQVRYTPGEVAVYASSVGFPFGANAVVNSVLKTATIQTPAAYTSIVWPNDVVDYVIAFDYDGYVGEYTILSLDVTKKIITYSDSANASVSAPAGIQWVIRGVKKEQRVELSSYVLHYAYLGDKNQRFPGQTSDSGPGNGGENPT